MKKERNIKTFEEVLEDCGGFGKFQFIVLIALLLPEIPAAFVAFAPVFVGRSTNHWSCIIDGNDTNKAKNFVGEMCDCPGTLVLEDKTSIVAEWGLICQHSWVSDFITSVQMLGMLMGSLFSSQISDWYGRKWVYFGVCGLMAFGQALSAFAPNPVVYAVARFFAGAGISGFMGMSTIYPLEFMTPNYRLLIGSVGPWGEGIILFAILAYNVTPWRSLLLISTLPFILVLAVVPFIPESPRYLLRQGKVDDALRVVRTIEKVNLGNSNKHSQNLISYQILEDISREETQGVGIARFSYLDFFRDVKLRRKILLLMGIWFSWSIVYFGISFNVNNLRGDIYFNVGLMGLSDALGYPAALLINNKLGRRKSLVVFMSLGAVFLVLLAALDLQFGERLGMGLVAILVVSGKFGVAGARSAARMLTGESFPTSIRTMGYGISGVTAGVGGVLAPQVAYFGSLWWGPLPFVTFAIISVGGSLLSLFLPETAGSALNEESSGLMGVVADEDNNTKTKKSNYNSTGCC